MIRTRVVALVALAALATPAVAHAGRCHRGLVTPRAPFDPAMSMREYGVGYGDFGTTPAACSFGSFGLDVAGGALLAGFRDQPNLYGVLTAAVNLRASIDVSDRFFLTANVGVFQYREVHNATIVVPGLSFGPVVLGAHVVAARGEHWQFAPYLRAMVSPGAQYAVLFGFEPGVSTMFEFARRFTVHAGLSVPISGTQLDASSWNLLVRGSLEIAARVANPVEIALGVDVRGRFLPSTAFDGLAPYLGGRVFVGSASAVQLTVSALNQGRDNTLARFSLGFWTSW